MKPSVILCVDSKTKNDPKLINLNEFNLKQEWLKVFTNALEFRKYINNHKETFEIWVSSSDDIEAINLAAAAKKDRSDCVVCLVSFNMSGSLQSRANAAHIDTIINVETLKERFVAKKQSNKVDIDHSNEFKLRNIPKINTTTKNKKAFVLSVVSASGGSGKSSVAAMAGMLSHTAGFKTLVLDADFQFGNLETMFKVGKPLYIDKYLENNELLINYHSTDNLPIVLCPPILPELSDRIISAFPSILDSLRNQFDVIIVNTGSYWNEIQALMLERDSKSLFLIDQRPSSITAAKKAIELCNRCGIATGSIIFAINKCSKHSLFSSIDISCALQGVHVAEIMDGGLDVDEFLSQGKPLELIKSQNSFAVSIWSILEGILPRNLIESKQKSVIAAHQQTAKFSPVINKGIGKLFRKRA